MTREGKTAAAAHTIETVQAHYAELAQVYDQRANRACKRAYLALLEEKFQACTRVLELGAGPGPLLESSPAPFRVACDISPPMLAGAAGLGPIGAVIADAQALPFEAGSFDGIFSINMLEHARGPARVAQESARLLAPGGRFLAVTPNGDVEWLLDLLERLHLKLPEGPHKFLDGRALAALAGPPFKLLEHRRFLAFPAGPSALVRAIDKIAGGFGLFQYLLLEKEKA